MSEDRFESASTSMTAVQGHDLDYYFYSLSKYHSALMTNIQTLSNVYHYICLGDKEEEEKKEVTKLM